MPNTGIAALLNNPEMAAAMSGLRNASLPTASAPNAAARGGAAKAAAKAVGNISKPVINGGAAKAPAKAPANNSKSINKSAAPQPINPKSEERCRKRRSQRRQDLR